MAMYAFGFDKNLGLNSQFPESIPCQIISTTMIFDLIKGFVTGQLDALFIPVGTLPHITTSYEIIAQATLRYSKEISMQARFYSLDMKNLDQIERKIIGRVNPFCTTSYWAALLLLMPLLPKGTKLRFKDTQSFENLVDQTATGNVDGSMIWDRVIKKHPEQVKKLSAFNQIDLLPTPVLIARKNLAATLIKQIQHFQTNDAEGYFSGLTLPNQVLINRFIKDITAAESYFSS